MKTKTLIEVLQELDPTGELVVCVGNEDIIEIDVLPAYYDGKLQVLQRDKTKDGYDITGIEIKSNGKKVKIEPYGLKYYVFDHHSELDKLNISFDHEPDQYTIDIIEEYRKKAKEFDEVMKRLRIEQLSKD